MVARVHVSSCLVLRGAGQGAPAPFHDGMRQVVDLLLPAVPDELLSERVKRPEWHNWVHWVANITAHEDPEVS
jgi:hypothetical protein